MSRTEADVRFGSKADICSAPTHVRFTPNCDRKSGYLRFVMSALPPKADMCTARGHVCFGPIADIGLTALLAKAHSRSRKCLIGRLLNAAEHKRANDRDSDCRNACRNEGSHDPPLPIYANGPIKMRGLGLYNHCPKRRM
jgi:hypothetical protein